MKERRASLARILRLQEQLNDISAAKLAEIEQRRAALEERRRSTIEAIDRDMLSHGILVETATRQLRHVDARLAKTNLEHDEQTRHARELALRAKLVERVSQKVEASHRAQQERAELSDLIERSLARKPASPA